MFPSIHGVVSQGSQGGGRDPGGDDDAPGGVTTGLRLWLDASDAATIVDAGAGKVSQWTSKDPDARVFQQATDSRRPVTGANTLNGLNVLDFDPGQLRSVDDKSVWNFLHAGESTVFIVIRLTANGAFLDTNAGASSSPGVLFQATGTRAIRHWVKGASSGDVSINNTGNSYWTPGDWNLYRFLTDPANATLADRSKIYRNGANERKNNASNGVLSTGDAAFTLQIGGTGGPPGTSTLSGARIAEIVAYEGTLSGTDIAAVESALASKWGITL